MKDSNIRARPEPEAASGSWLPVFALRLANGRIWCNFCVRQERIFISNFSSAAAIFKLLTKAFLLRSLRLFAFKFNERNPHHEFCESDKGQSLQIDRSRRRNLEKFSGSFFQTSFFGTGSQRAEIGNEEKIFWEDQSCCNRLVSGWD